MRSFEIIEAGVGQILNNNFNSACPKHCAIVEVKYLCLCGSDFKLFQGKYNAPKLYPIIPGHEWSGIIVSINSNTTVFNVGDHVTGDCSIWCGKCKNCNTNKNLCEHIQKYGITTNGFAVEKAIVPVKYLYQAPKKIALDVLALTEPFSVALNAIKKAGTSFEKNHKMLIVGAGMIGLCIYVLLRNLYNLNSIYLYESDNAKQEMIKGLFPDIFFHNASGSNNQNNYKDLNKKVGFEYVFEAAGNEKALKFAFENVQPLGKIICLGFYPESMIQMNLVTLKSLEIVGSIGGTGSFSEVIRFLELNENFVRPLITRVIAMEELSEILKIQKPASDQIKIQVKI